MELPLENRLINHFNKEELISSINKSDDLFNQMVEITLSNRNPKSWRAPWIINHTIHKNDSRIAPHFEAFVKAIDGKKDGYQRELLKIIDKIDIPEEFEGILFDKCSSIWEKPKKSPATRIVAFKIMLKIARKYPDLKNDISFLTQKHYTETLSPGIQKSLKRMIKEE